MSSADLILPYRSKNTGCASTGRPPARRISAHASVGVNFIRST